ncbi:unnamed protein product [Plutella xylostella]|uniref:(diamondback moth) hypothetical protein n=1 Tax=Plutella xylostella TaxID=51655 RepID=A0A8S4EJF3_PLUXY|nr:unnamed protein product [Plutella xylostella]
MSVNVNIPECPPSLKSIQHYLKTALEHDTRDPVVAYWCRLHALQTGLKITNKKTPEETKLLVGIMDWLEEAKKVHANNDAVSNEVAAQAHLENYALKVFLYADKQDREQNFGKNVVKAFYTAGMIYDVLTTFGELTDEAAQNRKYAKWKAAYIHNCLKNGETPIPGMQGVSPRERVDEVSCTYLVAGGSSGDQEKAAGFQTLAWRHVLDRSEIRAIQSTAALNTHTDILRLAVHHE